MSQTILKDDGIKQQSKKEKLELLRNNYYVQLKRELNMLNIRKRDLIKSYQITAKELDDEIRRLK
jgi:hypothetical protein